MNRRIIVPPVSIPFLFILALFMFLIFIFFSGVVLVAFEKLGLPADLAFTLFVFALVGSFINIPVAEETAYEPILTLREVRFFGISYPIPSVEWAERKTVIAVNVGGALLPASVAVYELLRIAYLGEVSLFFNTLLAVLISALFSNAVARPVKGLGIAMPMLAPPLMAVLMGWLLGDGNPNLVAYVSGTLGVLMGADLMNWDKLKKLGAPVVSIGGAGTFDGVFLAGIIAVILV